MEEVSRITHTNIGSKIIDEEHARILNRAADVNMTDRSINHASVYFIHHSVELFAQSDSIPTYKEYKITRVTRLTDN